VKDHLLFIKERLAKITAKQKVGLALAFFLIFGLLIVIGSKKTREIERGQPVAVKEELPGGIFAPVLRFLGVNQPEKEPVALTLTPPLTPTPSFPSVMEKTLNYIQSQYRKDGFYDYYPDYERVCPPNKRKEECPFKGVQMFETTNAWTALAYLAAYKIEKKAEYLDYAKRDLDFLADYCQIDLKRCFWVLPQFAEAYEITGELRYLFFLKDVGEALLINSDPNPMLKNIEARELALISEVTGEKRFSDEAEKRFVEAKAITPTGQFYYSFSAVNGEKTSVYSNTCWNVLAGVQLYQKPDKERELERIESFLKTINIPQVFNAYTHPVGIQPCIESYFLLGTLRGKEFYRGKARELLSLFIDRFWAVDSVQPERGAVWYSQKKNRKETDPKVLTDNCYLVYLLSK